MTGKRVPTPRRKSVDPVAAFLRKERVAQGLTLEELANRLGMTGGAMSAREVGPNKAFQQFQAWAKALGWRWVLVRDKDVR